MPKKPSTKQKGSKPEIPPGAVIYGKATSTTVDGIRVVEVYGLGGPMTGLIAKKGSIEIVLPGATFVNTSPFDKYVAWDGETYVLRPTLESIMETDDLRFIGRIDDPKDWSPLHQQVEAFNKIRELITGPKQRIPESLVRRTLADQYGCKPEEITPKQINFEVAGLLRYYPAIELIPSEPIAEEATPQANIRLSSTINSPSAARKMEAYIQAKGLGLTEFATQAQTTDRSLRRFRQTGKIRRDIFENIAKAMKITKEELISE